MIDDAYSQNAVDVGLSLDLIEEEIEKGLPSHADRLARAYECEEYLAGRNAAFLKRRASEEWIDYVNRPKRTSKLTRKVCRVLSEHLYNPGPTRKFDCGIGVDEWLANVYEKNHVSALMQKADQKAVLNSTSAIQAVCTGRPEKPVNLYLWGAHEFVPFLWPDDPTEPWAVCTIHRERKLGNNGSGEERLRLEVWSRDEHRMYATQWGPSADQYRNLFGLSARFIPELSGFPVGTGKNPYGILPFSFVHDELPVCSFWEGGIGDALKECNEEIDRELSDLAQVVKAHLAPDAFLRNVAASWRREKRPGAWQPLTPGKTADGDAAPGEPDAFYVQPQLAVEQVWYNIKTYADSVMEELDVPLTAVRDNLASPELSGIALVVKLIPLLTRTRGRQVPFTGYELDLLKLVLTAAGNYYQSASLDLDALTQGLVSSSANQLLAAAIDPQVEILWPEPSLPLPTPERDQQDAWAMQIGIKSLVDVVAQRNGCTREQAWERIEQVMDDNDLLAQFVPGIPMPGGPSTGTSLEAEPETDDEADDEPHTCDGHCPSAPAPQDDEPHDAGEAQGE